MSDITRALRAAPPSESANEAILIWQHLARKFIPLIGPSSVQLIVGRSIEACQAEFPWLELLTDRSLATPPYEGFRAPFDGAGKEALLAATSAMLMSYAGQLSTLIGGRLTEQFLRATFPAPAELKDTRSKPE